MVMQNHSVLCPKPHLRREWRTLTNKDKEAWTRAVKVKNNLSAGYARLLIMLTQCLVNHPSLTTKVIETTKSSTDPSYNSSGSVYDGASLSPRVFLVLILYIRFHIRAYEVKQ